MMSQVVDLSRPNRLNGLRRSAVFITTLNLLGHTVFGFEPSWAHPFFALLIAYTTEILMETLQAKAEGRPPRYLGGGFKGLVEFLLPAHITGLATSMLIYTGARFWVLGFTVMIGIISKYLFRVPLFDGHRWHTRHFLNPSNFAISLTLLLFPWVAMSPQYQYTENLNTLGGWLVPITILVAGSSLNAKWTKRIPLVVSWVVAFVLQALIRSWFFPFYFLASFLVVTGSAFLIFTMYMITDPATSPQSAKGQIAFGVAIAGIYGILMQNHITFGFFFALTIVTLIRGAWLWFKAIRQRSPEWLAKEVAAT